MISVSSLMANEPDTLDCK